MRANASGLRLNLTTSWRDKSVVSGFNNYAKRYTNDLIVVKLIENFLRKKFYERSKITYSHLSLVRKSNKSIDLTLFIYDGRFEHLLGKLKYSRNMPRPPWPKPKSSFKFKKPLKFLSFKQQQNQKLKKKLFKPFFFKKRKPEKTPLRKLFFKQRKNLIIRRYIRYRLHQLLYIHVIRNLTNNIYRFLGIVAKIYIILLWTKTLTSFSIGRFLVNGLRRHFRLPALLYPLMKRLVRFKSIRGIRVECSGRFNRKQRASNQVFKRSKVPISELGSLVSYKLHTVRLKYGLCGLKIWLFRKKYSFNNFKNEIKTYA